MSQRKMRGRRRGKKSLTAVKTMKILTFPVGVMQTNCYFLLDTSSTSPEKPIGAVVDPGDDADKLIEKIHKMNLAVQYIFLTHGHFDHIMALESLREATGAPVCIHRGDAELLVDPDKNCMARFSDHILPIRHAEILLEDEQTITIGHETVTVMHTPGHTPGSVCYLTEDAMLSGDTLFRGGIGRYDLYAGDYSALMISLGKISAMTKNYRVYPGHGSSTSLYNEKLNNLYLR